MAAAVERLVDVNGITLRVLDAGPADGPVVVLTHGFPELGFSWRHQVPVLARAGYRVIAPDQRGYGGSSRPESIEAYDIAALTGDVVGLLDLLGAQRAALVGHDWGAVVAWSTPQLHPDRVAAVAGLSVPPVPRPQTPPTEAFRRIFGENSSTSCISSSPGSPMPNWPPIRGAPCGGCWAVCGCPPARRRHCGCWRPVRRASSTGSPNRTGCRTG
jgi:pimeloyl-ACP methyl ester carboxylesterase